MTSAETEAPVEEPAKDEVDAIISEWPESESTGTLDGKEQTINQLLDEWGNGSSGNGESDVEASDESEDSWDDLYSDLGKTDEQRQQEAEQQLLSAVDTDRKVDEIVAWAQGVNTQFQNYRDGQDFSRVLSDVKLTLDRPDVSAEFVETHFAMQAQQRPEIATAWVQRYENPERWALIEKEMTTRLNKQLPEVPINDNDQRAAAVAFVRGSSTRHVPEPEVTNEQLSAMSDEEFNAYQKKLGVNP